MVIDNMIIFQKPFPGAARTELEGERQGQAREVQDGLERCLFWDSAGNRRAPQSLRAAGAARLWRRHSHKDALGYLPAGPNAAPATPPRSASCSVLYIYHTHFHSNLCG